jgi:hypothetical protein
MTPKLETTVSSGQPQRAPASDKPRTFAALRAALEAGGVTFIAEKRGMGGTGVRLAGSGANSM